ncbi:MAG: TRSP domain-containing protein, partial [Deltaproteobacteria bacterium]
FVLGRELAKKSHSAIVVHATTRSPIMVYGQIKSCDSFKDNYGEGVPNYLYNMNPARYGQIFICHETAPCPGLYEIAEKLGACLIYFHSENNIEESPVC